MGNLIRGLIGKALLAVLTVGVAITGYVVFIDFPTDPTFWKVAGTLLVLTATLTCALLSALTLSTRYVIVGVLGIASAFLAMVNSIYGLWSGTTTGSGLAGMPASPEEAMSSYAGSMGDNPVGNAVIICIALAALALPLVNAVLYLGYDSNPVGETVSVLTVAAMIASIVIIGVTTATEKGDASTLKWLIFLGIFAVAGFLGTLAASFLDSDRYRGGSVHYDINTAGELPSALPSSFQPPRKKEPRTTVIVEDEDPPLPRIEYSQRND